MPMTPERKKLRRIGIPLEPLPTGRKRTKPDTPEQRARRQRALWRYYERRNTARG